MRTAVRARRCILIVACATALVAPAPSTAPPSVNDALAAIRAYAPQAMAEQGTPGLAVAITDRTHTLAIITEGYANVDSRAPVTPQTRFAIGSITKSMTALALLQLRDAHELDLNANVRRYLPWFAIRSGGKPIVVHELLSHTSGLPDDFSFAPGYVYGIAALRDAHVLFPPGTSWSYANDGYATAGAVLSALDERPWYESLQARVLDPIGMTSSSPVFTPDTMAEAATGYEFRDADRPAPPHPALVASRPFDFVNPAGSVLSTPEDMARYLRFYLNGGVTEGGRRLLSAETFAAMTSPDRYRNGTLAGSSTPVLAEAPQFYRKYGYGLAIFGEHGDRVVGHTGGISGYTACMQANLTRGFAIIAMANLVEAPLHPCAIVLYAMRVLRAQALREPLPPPSPVTNPARVAHPTDYGGTYEATNGMKFSVVAGNARLTMLDGASTYDLYPRGPDLFWSSDPRYQMFLLHFGRNANRRVVEATYGGLWFTNGQYSGPRSWRRPSRWNALVGRYEDSFWGSPFISRVVIVKGTLTIDGIQPLVPLKNDAFALGASTVRFDTFVEGKAQRMTVDAVSLYRVELP